MDRVKFYSNMDWSSGGMLKKIENIMLKENQYSIETINDVIEAYNITKFVESGLRLPDWDSNTIDKYNNINKILLPQIGKFFTTINDSNFLNIIEEIELNYREDFIELFAKFNLQSRINWGKIKEALEVGKLYLSLFLHNEKIVSEYGNEIRSELLSNPVNAELLLSNLSMQPGGNVKLFVFPKCVTNNDVEILFGAYIDLPHPNLNYLNQIKTYRNGDSNYSISKTLQYKANQRIAELEKEIFEAGTGVMDTSMEISFLPLEVPKKVELNGLNKKISFDSEWIKNNLDYPTLLNNFIYLFEYVNLSFQINLYSKPHEASALESAITIKSLHDYFTSWEFGIKNSLADLEIFAYSKILRDHSIQLEDIIIWFYQDYLKEEYGIDSFQISLLKNHNDYYEMCKSIAPEIESIAKQYLVYVENGTIDHEYISVVNPSVIYQKIPSKNINKYAYVSSRETEYQMFQLFSDQSSLTCLPKMEKVENNLVKLIINHKPGYNDFEIYQKQSIDYLVSKGILVIDTQNSSVVLADIHKLLILRTLYDYGFISTQMYPPDYIEIIDLMISSGELKTESTLLSKQEASYFNYYLNSSEFGNSKDLRNKYAHGSAGARGTINQNDYYSLLKILVLLTLKIENDIRLSIR